MAVARLTLLADTLRLEELNAFIDRFVEDNGLPHSLSLSLQLVLEELFVNVANYGAAPDADRPAEVDIELTLQDQTLQVRLTDTGVPFDPLAAPEPDTEAGLFDREPGGFGIALVRTHMDSLAYSRRDAQNQLIMHKQLDG